MAYEAGYWIILGAKRHARHAAARERAGRDSVSLSGQVNVVSAEPSPPASILEPKHRPSPVKKQAAQGAAAQRNNRQTPGKRKAGR